MKAGQPFGSLAGSNLGLRGVLRDCMLPSRLQLLSEGKVAISSFHTSNVAWLPGHCPELASDCGWGHVGWALLQWGWPLGGDS